ncbi:glycoside hydrolase superfamily [Chlamydoabsidia padenii]|nr:glycoside hydrolase superfamily [Chlamydoabsidia padenii]
MLFNYALKAVVVALFAASALVDAGDTRHHNKPAHHPENVASRVKLSAYIVDWELPSKIAWSKLDHVYYAFAEPDRTGALGQFDKNQLRSVVKQAHSNKKTISLSVGGWSGSLHFSNLVKTSSARASFAKKLVQAVKEYNLDGIDIDWEYPNDPNGVACNAKNPADTENFLALMKLLRKELGNKKLITAAVSTAPFLNNKRQPSTSLSHDWAKTVDFFNVMVYDLSGLWNSVSGANAALKNSAEGSVETAIKQWKAAGIPSNKLVVGCPFYGYLARVRKPVTSRSERVAYTSSIQIKGDKYDTKSADPCHGAKAAFSGEYQYRSIVQEGIQQHRNSWRTYWDHKTLTPYAYNSKQKTLLTFDNPASLKAKAAYVVQNKLGGLMAWSLEMDDSKHSLLNSMQKVRH